MPSSQWTRSETASATQRNDREPETLTRLFTEALRSPKPDRILAQILELSHRHPKIVARAVAQWEGVLASSGHDAATVALLLHDWYDLRGDNARRDRLLPILATRFNEVPKVQEKLAQLATSDGDRGAAIRHLERALELHGDIREKRRLLRRLRDASIEAGHVDVAVRYSGRLIESSPSAEPLRIEFGRALLMRAEYEAALGVLEPLTRSPMLKGSARAGLFRDVAAAALATGNVEKARKSIEFALKSLDGAEDIAVLKEIAARVFRRGNGLDALIRVIENESPARASCWTWLAELNEELGLIEPALAYRRRAIQQRPQDLAGQLALLHTLEIAGDREALLDQRRRIVERFPGQVDQALLLVFDWYRQGDQNRAETLLRRLEQRGSADPESIYRIADVWERLGHRAHAQRLLAQVRANSQSAERSAPWTATPTPSRESSATASSSTARLAGWTGRAEALIEQGHIQQAVEQLDAIRQDATVTPSVLNRVATLIERAAASANHDAQALREQAEALWTKLLDSDLLSHAETVSAIDHVVRLWARRGRLAEHAAQLTARFSKAPTNHTLGLWLAEAQTRLGHLDLAERTLRAVSLQSPEDLATLDKLEHLAVKRGDFSQAIALCERRLRRDGALAPTLLRRLVDYASKARRDELAVEYAKRSVDGSPNDAGAWLLYARLLRTSEGTGSARASKALSRAEDLAASHPEVALELADWLVANGETRRAWGQLLGILRNSNAESLLLDAAHRILPLAAVQGLESLELALKEATLRAPRSQELRHLLLELYVDLARQLKVDMQATETSRREAALTSIERLRPRAGATIVAVLADRKETRQTRALELLSLLEPRGLGDDLMAFAASAGPPDDRTRAVLLAASDADPKLLPRFAAMLRTRASLEQTNPMARAAAFGISRIGSPEATAMLRQLLRRSSPELQGYAALWLAERRDSTVLRELEDLQQNADVATTRASADLALMRLTHHAPRTMHALSSTSPIEHLMRLARVASRGSEVSASEIAELLAASSSDSFAAAVSVVTRWTDAPCPDWHRVLEDPESATDLASVLRKLSRCSPSARNQMELFDRVATPLGEALRQRVLMDNDAAIQLGRLILADAKELSLAPLSPDRTSLAAPDQQLLTKSLKDCLTPIARGYEHLIDHEDAALRAAAIGVRTRVLGDERALLRGLTDDSLEIRLKSLEWAPFRPSHAVAVAVSQQLRHDPSFQVRGAAAGVLAQLVRPTNRPDVLAALRHAARHDPFAAVRMAALSGFARTNPLAAREELSYAEAHDSEPEVVSLARRLRENRP